MRWKNRVWRVTRPEEPQRKHGIVTVGPTESSETVVLKPPIPVPAQEGQVPSGRTEAARASAVMRRTSPNQSQPLRDIMLVGRREG